MSLFWKLHTGKQWFTNSSSISSKTKYDILNISHFESFATIPQPKKDSKGLGSETLEPCACVVRLRLQSGRVAGDLSMGDVLGPPVVRYIYLALAIHTRRSVSTNSQNMCIWCLKAIQRRITIQLLFEVRPWLKVDPLLADPSECVWMSSSTQFELSKVSYVGGSDLYW